MTCAACGTKIGYIVNHLGDGDDQVVLCEQCRRAVTRGQQPLIDGRWWAQEWRRFADGQPWLAAVGPWTTENTWASGPPANVVVDADTPEA